MMDKYIIGLCLDDIETLFEADFTDEVRRNVLKQRVRMIRAELKKETDS